MPEITVQVLIPEGVDCMSDNPFHFCQFCRREGLQMCCEIFDMAVLEKCADDETVSKKCPACLAACKKAEEEKK